MLSKSIIGGVSQIESLYHGFLLDQYGCLHDGVNALPGALDAVEKLSVSGKRMVIVSNTSSRASFAVERLKRFGFNPDMFLGGITSGEEALKHMKAEGLIGARAVILGWNRNGEPDPDGFMAEARLKASDPTSADFVLCHGSETIVTGDGPSDRVMTGFRESGDLSLYETTLKACAERNLPMINCNPDLVSRPGSGDKLLAMPGQISNRYKDIGGEVRWFGKPNASHFHAGVALMGLQKENRIIHVGDSLYHDIDGACRAGLDTLFVGAGIHATELGLGLENTEIHEKALAILLEKYQIQYPTYTLPYLSW